MSKLRKSIIFNPLGHQVEVDEESTLLQLALDNEIEMNHSCGGMGSCGTCRVIIEEIEEPLPKRNEVEKEMALAREFRSDERLSCQFIPKQNLKVRIPSPS